MIGYFIIQHWPEAVVLDSRDTIRSLGCCLRSGQVLLARSVREEGADVKLLRPAPGATRAVPRGGRAAPGAHPAIPQRKRALQRSAPPPRRTERKTLIGKNLKGRE